MIKKILFFVFLTSTITIYGGSSWRKATEATYSSLSDVFFLNDNVGWIAGLSGTILKTTDGGHTWEGLSNPLPAVVSMYSIFFIDENIGFTGGYNDLFLKSTDGGANWTPIQLPVIEGNVYSIYFTDENTGWILVGTASGGKVLYTTNGGSEWSVQLSETSLNLKAMSFSSPNHGVCAGGKSGNFAIYSTNDGLNWVKSPTPTGIPPVYSRTDIYEVSMASDDVVCATGWGSSASGLQPTFTLRSTDGGANWTYETQAEEDRLYVNMYGIDFKDELTGISVGGSSYKGGVAYKTVDGGLTWKEVYLPSGFQGKDISYSGNKICIVGSGGGIIISDDDGETWELKTEIINSTLYDIKLLPNGNIVAAGFYGGFLYSTDGGSTWGSKFVADNNVCPTVENLFFLDENIGYAAQRNRTVSKTTDGGMTWTQIMKDTMATTMNNYDVQFINENLGYVVGKANSNVSAFYKTTDGGANWSVLEAHPALTNELNTLYFFDENNGVVAGDESALAYTTDGGVNWTKVTPSNMPAGLYDYNEIKFVNDNFGLAAGEKLIKSNDGGKTWQYVEVDGLTKKIEGIAIVNELIWYLTGSKFLYVTEDAGRNWTDIFNEDAVTANTNYSVMVDANDYTWLACGSSEIYSAAPTVNVKTVDNNVVDKFSLEANYPNPFNPSTKIKYSIPVNRNRENSFIRLNVYNLLGEEVATLVNEVQKAGTYEVEFNASMLTSGIYIYRLQSDKLLESRKMLLIK
jgi:photosystem II stability/assembly factor-like uncharacterized protein